MELNDVHQAQLSRFGAFFRARRDAVVAERDSDKNDFLADHITDPSAIFNASDVHSLFEAYHAQVMMNLREEMDRSAGMAGVYASFLMAQAESVGATLQAQDVSMVEDASRIQQVEALAALNAPPLAPKPTQLTAIQGGGATDLAALQELQELRERYRQIEDHNLKMQADLECGAKERSGMAAELEQVKANLQQHLLRNADADASSSHVAEYERALNESRAECDMLKADLQQRLNESSQFRDLKSMLKRKSDEIKELRQIMASHGLQVGGNDGVDLDAADSD